MATGDPWCPIHGQVLCTCRPAMSLGGVPVYVVDGVLPFGAAALMVRPHDFLDRVIPAAPVCADDPACEDERCLEIARERLNLPSAGCGSGGYRLAPGGPVYLPSGMPEFVPDQRVAVVMRWTERTMKRGKVHAVQHECVRLGEVFGEANGRVLVEVPGCGVVSFARGDVRDALAEVPR